MKKDRVRAHCPRCRHTQVFVKATINHPLHIVLAVVTGGLWLVSWVALCIGRVLRPWRCEHCGWHVPEFRTRGHSPELAKTPRPAKAPRFSPPPKTRPEHPGAIIASQTGQLRA